MIRRRFIVWSIEVGLTVAAALASAGCGGENGQPARGSLVTPPRERDSVAGSPAEKVKGRKAVKGSAGR